jgi:hypothetical protein
MAAWDGDVRTDWLSDGRSMQLLNDVAFLDNRGRRWQAWKGDIVDGASIPRFFWRFIGSPFVGKYRRASVIHDVYCKTEVVRSPEVHKMFYEAMRHDGVPRVKAYAMWLAVRTFGPRFKGVV